MWTDERIAALRQAVADGLSASQIAAEMGGVTRNAVIGKAHRLGLYSSQTWGPKADSQRSQPRPRKPVADWSKTELAELRRLWLEGHDTGEIARRIGRSRSAVVGRGLREGLPSLGRGRHAKAAVVHTGAPLRQRATTFPPAPRPVNMMKLAAGHCRRPLWAHDVKPKIPEMMFCGNAAEAGRSYCEGCGWLLAPYTGRQ